ncbi:hypothetical protein BB561_003643 [Smittium simulii]|uniref:Histidine kinase/HSP90-like ATPase domain-containing protein n=1 Tax=Smittium simulii TaxID=133385 RepID=A0A2T9YK74_9FUNG|nr:hypothetical protein BB561_003643 [Smittium simulii]
MFAARARLSGTLSKRLALPLSPNPARYSSLLKPTLCALKTTKNVVQAQKRFETTKVTPKVDGEKCEFQAETKKLLQIVAHSLYSQREVFVRELISNASDAMEKLRYLSLSDSTLEGEGVSQINIDIDSEKKTITIQDFGIGMTEQELRENLGTIARSGSKKYIESLNGENDSNEASKNIVGQFGVGFYSGFMVGDTMEVYSRSAKEGGVGYCWKSDGLGYYTLNEADNVPIGTKVVIHVKGDAKEFLDTHNIKVNTVDALWLKDKNSITEEEHNSFYKHISNEYSEPLYKLIYSTDAPISIRSLLYIPKSNPELLGFERTKPGVSLYSRKVLIMPNSETILPEWLRFVRGVIDSEDLPLNLSRELLQQGTVIQKIKSVITNRIITWLRDESRKNPEEYKEFFKSFGLFIKEGVFSDESNKEKVASLLRFESSLKSKDEYTSFDEYISRMNEADENIFYLCTSNRKFGEESPYFEPFKKANKEVIFFTQPQDEHVMNSLKTYKKKKLVSIDSENARTIIAELESLNENDESSETKKNETGENNEEGIVRKITKEEGEKLAIWFRETLGTKVKEVKTNSYSSSFPAIVTSFDSPATRKMMIMMAGSTNMPIPLSPCNLEINLKDPIITGLFDLKSRNPELAAQVAEQIFDNALVSAGIMDEPRSMVRRLNSILSEVVKK